MGLEAVLHFDEFFLLERVICLSDSFDGFFLGGIFDFFGLRSHFLVFSLSHVHLLFSFVSLLVDEDQKTNEKEGSHGLICVILVL